MSFCPQHTFFSHGRVFLIVPMMAASENGITLDTTCQTFMRYAEFMRDVEQELDMLQVMLRRGDIVGYGPEALADIERYMAMMAAWKGVAHIHYAPRTQVTPEQLQIQQLGLRAAVFSSTYAQDHWIKSATSNRVFSARAKKGGLGSILRDAFARDFILPDRGLPTFSYFHSMIEEPMAPSLVGAIEAAWIQCGYPTAIWETMGKPACLARIEEHVLYTGATECELTAAEVSVVLQDQWSIMFPDQNLFHEYAQIPFRKVKDPTKEHTKEDYLSTLTQFLLAVASAFLHDQGRPCDNLGEYLDAHASASQGVAKVVIQALESGESVTHAVLSYVSTCLPHMTFTEDEMNIIHQRYTFMYLDRGSQVHGFDEVFMRSYNPSSPFFHYQGAHSVEWSTFFTQIVALYPALAPVSSRFADFIAERQRAFANVPRTADNILEKPLLTYTQADLSLDDTGYTRDDFFQYSRATQMALLARHPEWFPALDKSQMALPLGKLQYTVRDLLAAGYTAADLRLCEFTMSELWQGGVSVWQLYKAQYAKLSSLKYNFSPLEKFDVGICVEKIQLSGGDPRNIMGSRNLMQIRALRNLRCSVADFTEMGAMPYAVYEALYPQVQWMEAELDADFYATLTTAYRAGKTQAAQRIIPVLRALGYSLLDLCQAGFSARVLRETCQLSLWQACALGFRKQALLEAGFPAWRVQSVKSCRRFLDQPHLALPPASLAAIRVYKGSSTVQKPPALTSQ